MEDLSTKVRQRRLRWFEHIRKAKGSLLSEVEEGRIGGIRVPMLFLLTKISISVILKENLA